jgi:hypothetical protein
MASLRMRHLFAHAAQNLGVGFLVTALAHLHVRNLA